MPLNKENNINMYLLPKNAKTDFTELIAIKHVAIAEIHPATQQTAYAWEDVRMDMRNRSAKTVRFS